MADLAVIGGGLAGAALVLALRREGQTRVTWYTGQDCSQTPVETFLQLPPNATRVLKALGVRQQLEAVALHPQSLLHRAADNSFVWTELPLGGFVTDRFKAPFLCADPVVLLALLHNACRKLAGTQSSLRPRAAAPDGTVQEADGQSRRFDLVVLASGADAELCPELQTVPANPEPLIAYRAQLPLGTLPPALAQPVLTRWSDPNFELWTLPDPDRGELLLTLHPTTSDVSAARGAPAAALQDRTSPQALPFWAAAADWQPARQRLTLPPDHFYSGNLVLCGNAAHRLPFSSELGAALALEDAWVLSRLIEQNEGTPGAVGPEFERYRAPRTRQLRQRSARERQRWFSAAPPRRALHRLRVMLTHRFLPEFAYQELDWLYGYDCIRGFR